MNLEKSCPICGSNRCEIFLTRNNVPVHQNLLFDDRYSAEAVPRGDLTLTVCLDCGFIFNASSRIIRRVNKEKYVLLVNLMIW